MGNNPLPGALREIQRLQHTLSIRQNEESCSVASENDVSSTEKLLTLIRRKNASGTAGDTTTEFPAADKRQRLPNKWLPARPRSFAGVEILRDRINLVQMRRNKGNWELAAGAVISVPEAMHLEHPNFPEFFKARLLQHLENPHQTKIWTSLAPTQGEIWTTRVPKLRRGLSNAVYWASRKERPFDEKENLFDYRIAGKAGEDSPQQWIAETAIAASRQVRLYRSLFQRAGLPLQGVTLPAFALENLFAGHWITAAEENRAILYIGEEASCIDIYNQDRLVFSRIVKTGRDSILDSLRMEYDRQHPGEEGPDPDGWQEQSEDAASLDRTAAARVLEQMQEPTDRVFAMIQPALERLARQLERTIDHSINVLQHSAPGRIYICGAASFVPGIAEFFNEQLGVSASVADILPKEAEAAFPGLSRMEPHKRLPLATAAGLAMPSAETINFLHTAFDKDQEKKALFHANMVAAGCALVFALTAGWWWMDRMELKNLEHRTLQAEKRLENYSPVLERQDLLDMADQVQKRQNRLRDLSRSLRPAAVIKEINRITPQHIRLLNLRLDPGSAGEAEAGKGPGLILEGFINAGPSRARTDLTAYMLDLNRSVLFEAAKIRSSAEKELHPGRRVFGFTIALGIKEGRDEPMA